MYDYGEVVAAINMLIHDYPNSISIFGVQEAVEPVCNFDSSFGPDQNFIDAMTDAESALIASGYIPIRSDCYELWGGSRQMECLVQAGTRTSPEEDIRLLYRAASGGHLIRQAFIIRPGINYGEEMQAARKEIPRPEDLDTCSKRDHKIIMDQDSAEFWEESKELLAALSG